MIYAVLFSFSIALFELFALLNIGRDAMAIIARSQEAMRVLMSSELGDDDKEVLMRRGSADIFKATLRFALKFHILPGSEAGAARESLLSGRHRGTDGRDPVLCMGAQGHCFAPAKWR
jgi:hypothetical protein